jgi:predicted Zn-dependent peptidase
MPGPLFPVVERYLDNGLRVVVNTDHAVPAVAVTVMYGVGSRHDPVGRTGFAHLFEHLMFQGSANVGPGEHASIVEGVGGFYNGTTSFDVTTYYQTVPDGALDLALWLEADRMGGLLAALTQENLDNQRDVVKNERRQNYDNVPYGTAYERLFRLAIPAGHPYHHLPIGRMADLDAATRDDCARFFTEHYLPNNAVLSIVGDVEPDVAFSSAERYLGAIPSGPPPPRPPDTVPPPPGGATGTVDEQVPSGAVYRAYLLPPDGTPEAEAAAMLFRVLGSGRNSRLHRRLVRGDQLARQAWATVWRLTGGVSVGIVGALARHRVPLDDVQAAIDEELARVATGPTPAELATAKAMSRRGWLGALGAYGWRAEWIARFAVLHDDPDMVNRFADRIDAVTADQAAAIATQRLVPANRATLTYPNAEALPVAASGAAQPGATRVGGAQAGAGHAGGGAR